MAYKKKVVDIEITEDHFKMFLQHDGELCTCPNPEHEDGNTGSVTYVDFNTGNKGIHCWVCDETWNLYDTIKMVDKNSILRYTKLIKNINQEKIDNNETVERKVIKYSGIDNAAYKAQKEEDDRHFGYFTDLKHYYESQLKSLIFDSEDYNQFIMHDEYALRDARKQMQDFIPFLWNLNNLKNGMQINEKMLKSIKFERSARKNSLVIPFRYEGEIRNTFYYRDERGKYVPKTNWYREYKDYYDMPIFIDECLENKKVNNNNFVLICEGVKDAFNANLLGYSAITSGGVTNTKPLLKSIEKLEEEFEYIVIALDNDKAGRANIHRYSSLFKKEKVIILTNIFEDGEDFSDFITRQIMFNEEEFKITINQEEIKSIDQEIPEEVEEEVEIKEKENKLSRDFKMTDELANSYIDDFMKNW